MKHTTVASFTDAWIETWIIDFNMFVDAGVASFTDAWIETLVDQYYQREKESHPLRMRGLKLRPKGLL